MKCIIAIFSLMFVITGCQSTSSPKPVIPANGGASIDVGNTGWKLSGVKVAGMESFEVVYPQAEETEHFKVVNAGFILANGYGKRSQIIYQFELNVKALPQERAYTRAILENPVDPSSPFIYEHQINNNERSTNIIHGPLHNVVLHKKYNLKLELYADAARTELMDKVEQVIISSLDNTSGCVEMSPDYKKVYLGGTTGPTGNVIPLDKLMILCVI